MGVTLERSRIAESLLESISALSGTLRGGLGIAVVLVGMLMAASTGIVGATVVMMGLLSLPAMLRQGYDPKLATGTIVATGTLGQIIPPSISLVLLGDVLSSAYQQAQLGQGIFSPKTVSVGDLFAGSLIPGILLVVLYILYILAKGLLHPEQAPAVTVKREKGFYSQLIHGLVPRWPLSLLCLDLFSLASPRQQKQQEWEQQVHWFWHWRIKH